MTTLSERELAKRREFEEARRQGSANGREGLT
jgi:hypothetical protein